MKSNAKPDMGKILSSVPREIGFHFSDEKFVYTGITALSLAEFALKMETVPVNSILFHYPRGDFQKWIQGTLGDEVLANRLSLIQSGLLGENLRMQILRIVKSRINELGILKPKTKEELSIRR